MAGNITNVTDKIEKSLEPREGRYLFCPGCGGEVYAGESLYGFSTGKSRFEDTPERYICGRCLVDAVSGLKPEDLAWLAGIKNMKVSFSKEKTDISANSETEVMF